MSKGGFYMDANKYRTAYDKAQAVQHEVWTELCQHLEHAPDAQLLSDYTATLVYTLDKDRREEALRLLRGQLYSRQLRDTGRVESWFTDCGARMGQDIEGFVANARQQYVQAGLAEEQRAEAEAKQKAGRGRFRIRPASAFAPERAAYLVQPYLPRGMVSILGGVSAAGKTSLALDVCARLTRGAAFAPDTPPQPPATVLYLTAENDPNKVLRPRAEAMGADLDRLYFQDGASYSMGDEELAALCRVYRPALLVFDPIQSYLGQGVQMNRAEQVRPLLDHLGALAKELDMAVLLISHMSKPGPGVCSALDRLLGSSDFRNAARSILIAGYRKMIRYGFLAIIIIPLIFLILMFSLESKIVFLVLWIISIIAIATWLIIVEFIHTRLAEQQQLAGMSFDEMVKKFRGKEDE